MFNNYLKTITEAMKKEEEINKNYLLEKEKNNLKFKKILEEEIKSFDKISLKDYSITKHQNNISETKIEEDNINVRYQEDLKVLVNNFNLDIGIIKETYKTIPIVNGNNGIMNMVCRVYFTLIKTEFCNIGDVYKIEYFNTIDNKVKNTYIKDNEDIKIPVFLNACQIHWTNNFLSINNIGENEKTWWLEWVKKFKPI
jgi:hypothetical protein